MQEPTRTHYRIDSLLLGALFLFALAQLVFTQLPVPSDYLRQTVGTLIFIPVYLVATLLSFSAISRHQDKRKRSWTFYALALLSLTVGHGIYTFLVYQNAVTFPSWADVGLLLFFPLMYAGVVQIREDAQPPAKAVLTVLDLVIVLLAIAVGYWDLILFQDWQGSTLGVWQRAVALAYPLANLALFALLTVLSVWNSRIFSSLRMMLIILGTMCFLLTHTVHYAQIMHGTYQPGEALDFFRTLGIVAIGLAGFLSGRTHRIRHAARLDATIIRYWPRIAFALRETLPYVAVTFSIYMALVHFFKPDAAANGVMIATTVVTLLALLRQGLMQLHSYRMQRELDRQAKYDALTGLMNRKYLSERLSVLLEDARRNSKTVAVMFMDLDRFKFINDVHGHAAGDMVLRTVAGYIRASVRQGDLVARLGGDEFVIVLAEVQDAAEAGRIAQRILQSVSRSLELDRQDLSVTGSIGITLCPAEAG
ncbi:diguanylate cyclase (GGDEF)-like protein, partial [Deinobacterium chartae]|nr:diguanylate cyclase (GGDEF)-like protein [Deinobacterium chartae]